LVEHTTTATIAKKYCDKMYMGVYLCFFFYIHFCWVLDYIMQKKAFGKIETDGK